LQKPIHTLNDLAERAGIESNEDLAGVGNGASRECELMRHHIFQAPVEDERLFSTVRDYFDLPYDNIGAGWIILHTSRRCAYRSIV